MIRGALGLAWRGAAVLVGGYSLAVLALTVLIVEARLEAMWRAWM